MVLLPQIPLVVLVPGKKQVMGLIWSNIRYNDIAIVYRYRKWAHKTLVRGQNHIQLMLGSTELSLYTIYLSFPADYVNGTGTVASIDIKYLLVCEWNDKTTPSNTLNRIIHWCGSFDVYFNTYINWNSKSLFHKHQLFHVMYKVPILRVIPLLQKAYERINVDKMP